jgi:DNA-binding transcriptional ArsR family regulator
MTLMLVEPMVLAAVASPRRREILRLVWENELGAGEIHAAMPDVSFGAVSLQLRALSNAGLLDCRREHRRRFYKARRAPLGPVAASLERMWGDALWRLKLLAELEHSRRGPRPRRSPSRRGRPIDQSRGSSRKTSIH